MKLANENGPSLWRYDRWWVLLSMLVISLSVTLELPGLAAYPFFVVLLLLFYRYLFPDGAPQRVTSQA